MIYGNCLLCALVLIWIERHNNPKFIIKYRPGTSMPHFMVRTKDKLHHFKVAKDILCWPFCYIIFKGQFQTVNISEEDNYDKHRLDKKDYLSWRWPPLYIPNELQEDKIL